MKVIYLKSKYKSNSFDVSICVKISFFRMSVNIEPDHCLLTVRYHKPFEKI